MRLPASAFVDVAEAAFIAEVSEGDFSFALDEHIVPASFVLLSERRRVARICAALISIYFKTEPLFTAQLRKDIVRKIAQRVEESQAVPRVSCLSFDDEDAEAMTHLFRYSSDGLVSINVDLWSAVLHAAERARRVDLALDCVSVNESVLGGAPVFKGSRVPIEATVASLDVGIGLERLRKSYDFLTPELIEAARTYLQVRPLRGPSGRPDESQPPWNARSTKVVR